MHLSKLFLSSFLCLFFMAGSLKSMEIDEPITILDFIDYTCKTGYHLGYTPLLRAICDIDILSVKKLLELGADVNKAAVSQSVLHLAIKKNAFAITQLLLDYKADIHATDYEGKTPIEYAVKYNFTEIIPKLICHGANIEILKNNTEIYLTAKKLMTRIFKAVKSQNIEELHKLINEGYKFDVIDENFKSTIDYATETDNKDVFGLLLMHGAKPTAKTIELLIANTSWGIFEYLKQLKPIPFQKKPVKLSIAKLIIELCDRIAKSKLTDFFCFHLKENNRFLSNESPFNNDLKNDISQFANYLKRLENEFKYYEGGIKLKNISYLNRLLKHNKYILEQRSEEDIKREILESQGDTVDFGNITKYKEKEKKISIQLNALINNLVCKLKIDHFNISNSKSWLLSCLTPSIFKNKINEPCDFSGLSNSYLINKYNNYSNDDNRLGLRKFDILVDLESIITGRKNNHNLDILAIIIDQICLYNN